MRTTTIQTLKIRVRTALTVFIILLVLSGLTAFPMGLTSSVLHGFADRDYLFASWFRQVAESIDQTPRLIFYGTDWLAFAHIVIAIFFIPVAQDPVRNKAVLSCGLAACVLVIPLAFICGPIRGIPILHQLIDCSFGVFGFILLFYIRSLVIKLERSSL